MVRMMPGLVSTSASSANSKLTINRMTSRGVKCSPRLVGELGEPTDELLVEVAHLEVRHLVWVEIDLGELGHDQVEQVGPVEPVIWVSKSNLSRMSRAPDENPAM